jgi:hypothetical protein
MWSTRLRSSCERISNEPFSRSAPLSRSLHCPLSRALLSPVLLLGGKDHSPPGLHCSQAVSITYTDFLQDLCCSMTLLTSLWCRPKIRCVKLLPEFAMSNHMTLMSGSNGKGYNSSPSLRFGLCLCRIKEKVLGRPAIPLSPCMVVCRFLCDNWLLIAYLIDSLVGCSLVFSCLHALLEYN